MSSREFLTQVILIGLLIFVSTGLSLFDRESRFNKLNEKGFEDKAAASIMQTPGGLPSASLAPGGGITKKSKSPEIEEEPLLQKDSSPDFLPVRDWNVPDPEITAAGAIVYRTGDDKIFYQKNIYEALPIASLTKLVTALVITEHIPLDDTMTVSKRAVLTEGEAGNLIVGEEITIKNLLYALLVESSNDAAIALEDYFNAQLPERTLVDTMNKKALEIGLSRAVFKNPSGLDQKGEISNVASAIDLAVLANHILETNPIIVDMVGVRVIDVHSVNGWYSHHLVSSNKLLGILPEVIGGKTGYTEKAEESLLVLFTSPSGDEEEVLISVVLNSADREGDTRVLLDWIKKAYLW